MSQGGILRIKPGEAVQWLPGGVRPIAPTLEQHGGTIVTLIHQPLGCVLPAATLQAIKAGSTACARQLPLPEPPTPVISPGPALACRGQGLLAGLELLLLGTHPFHDLDAADAGCNADLSGVCNVGATAEPHRHAGHIHHLHHLDLLLDGEPKSIGLSARRRRGVSKLTKGNDRDQHHAVLIGRL